MKSLLNTLIKYDVIIILAAIDSEAIAQFMASSRGGRHLWFMVALTIPRHESSVLNNEY